MKYFHCLMVFALAVFLSSCGDKDNQVQQPVKGAATTGSGTNAVARVTVTPAPPPPVTSTKPTTTLFPPAGSGSAATAKTADASASKPATVAKPATDAKAEDAKFKSILPTAKVVMVNTEMKFVVLEFTTSQIPTAGSQITVYRDKARVATVKATDPMKPPLVTADILDGEPRKGDEVR